MKKNRVIYLSIVMIIGIFCIVSLKTIFSNDTIKNLRNTIIPKMSPQDLEVFEKIKKCVLENDTSCLNKILKIEHGDLNFQFIVESPQAAKSNALILKIIVKNTSNKEKVIIEPKINRVSELYESKGYMQYDYFISFYISDATWCHLLQPNQEIIIPIDFLGYNSVKGPIFKKGKYKLNYNISVPVYNEISINSTSGSSKTIHIVYCIFKVIDNNGKIEFKSM